jgi:hypothetical protein
MSDAAIPGSPVSEQPSLEQKLCDATAQAAQIVAGFSKPAAVLIESGVAVEPIVSGLIHMIAGLFHHHAKQAAAGK